MINIYNDPMTSADIVAARQIISDGHNIEDSIAFKVFLYCPVPVVDIIAGLTTHAVTSMISSDPMADFSNVRGAILRDWSSSEVTARYVDKVRQQNRPLIAAEVSALELHLSVMSKADYAVDVTKDMIANKVSETWKDMFKR